MSSKKSTSKSKSTSKAAKVEASNPYRQATELDFQMNASYLVLDAKGNPQETWPKDNDNLAKQAIKYSGLVSRGLVVIKD